MTHCTILIAPDCAAEIRQVATGDLPAVEVARVLITNDRPLHLDLRGLIGERPQEVVADASMFIGPVEGITPLEEIATMAGYALPEHPTWAGWYKYVSLTFDIDHVPYSLDDFLREGWVTGAEVDEFFRGLRAHGTFLALTLDGGAAVLLSRLLKHAILGKTVIEQEVREADEEGMSF